MKAIKSILTTVILCSALFVSAKPCSAQFITFSSDKKVAIMLGTIIQSVFDNQSISDDDYFAQIHVARPRYVPFMGTRPVYSIFMREQLVLPAFKRQHYNIQYIGTYNLGTCIALIVKQKKNGVLQKSAIAHIDSFTTTKSVAHILATYFADKDGDLEIILISRDNPKSRAAKILKKIFEVNPSLKDHSKIFMDLSASESVALNTTNGDISINIPRNDMIFSRSLDTGTGGTISQGGPYIIPSGLLKSTFTLDNEVLTF